MTEDVFDLHLFCHDWEAVDGGAPVLHECEEIVKETFSGGVHVELIQLRGKLLETSNGKQLETVLKHNHMDLCFHSFMSLYFINCVFLL